MKSTLAVALMLLTAACASRGELSGVRRAQARYVHEKVRTGRAILACAYSDSNCQGTHLKGSITLEELESRMSTLVKEQEIILFCG